VNCDLQSWTKRSESHLLQALKYREARLDPAKLSAESLLTYKKHKINSRAHRAVELLVQADASPAAAW
jgi:hypothetical protein